MGELVTHKTSDPPFVTCATFCSKKHGGKMKMIREIRNSTSQILAEAQFLHAPGCKNGRL